MNDLYIFLYLLYGFVFILFGLYSVSKYRKTQSIFPLSNSIIYIGLFGLAHGLSEWLTMLRLAEVFDEYRIVAFYLGRVLKGFSFIMLIQFGVSMFFNQFISKFFFIALLVVYGIWLALFYRIIFVLGMNYLYNNPAFLIITLRYFMALPGALLTSAAMFYHGYRVKALNKTWMYYYILFGFTILFYGILDGLFVRQAHFFPANVFYNNWFIDTFNIPIQVLKIIVGLFIYLSIRLVFTSFSWEVKTLMNQAYTSNKDKDYTSKINFVIHDEIIQSLYVTSMQINKIQHRVSDASVDALCKETNQLIEDNIQSLRNIIKGNDSNFVSPSTLDETIKNFIDKLFHDQKVHLSYHNHLHKNNLLSLNKTVVMHIYFIIQEALMNIAKHARANTIVLSLRQELNYLKVVIKDDGMGFNIKQKTPSSHIGLTAMQDRIDTLNGKLILKSTHKSHFLKTGTTITFYIPMEVHHEKTNDC